MKPMYITLIIIGLVLVAYGAGGLRAHSLTKSIFSCPLKSVYPEHGVPLVWIAHFPPDGLTCQPGTVKVNVLSGKVLDIIPITVHHSSFFQSPQIRHLVSQHPAFSFDYPAFEGWTTTVEPSMTEIRWNPPADFDMQFEVPPNVYWKEVMMKVPPDFWSSKPKNAHGIHYDAPPMGPDELLYEVVFNLPKQGVSIEMSTPRGDVYKDFTGEVIYKTILDSFAEDTPTAP